MTTFKNIFGTEITIKPFFHNPSETYMVARYENGELNNVYENQGHERYIDCVIACQEHFDKIS